jgi:hypothetical protein
MGLINLVTVYGMQVSDIAAGNIIQKDKIVSTNLTLSPTDVQSIGGTFERELDMFKIEKFEFSRKCYYSWSL